MEIMKTEKKVVIITGGAQGIGKATAKLFLEEGVSVVIVDIDEEAGKETAVEFKAIGDIVFLAANMMDESHIQNVVNKTYEQFKRIDYVVNNSGVIHTKPIEKTSLEDWNKIISINLSSAFLLTKYSIPFLQKVKGSIVNIASTRALMSEPNTEAYAASKGGLVALTHALAISLGPDIRVNCISPGWIETSEWKKSNIRCNPSHSEIELKQHPVGRIGEPYDVASLVIYLVSNKASFITGQNFIVDGGMTSKMIYV